MDVGCGGTPITDYIDATPRLTLLDPLLDDLVKLERYSHLRSYAGHSCSVLEFTGRHLFDVITCLNVVDHFHDDELDFIEVFHRALRPRGELWLYYDVRPVNADDHLAVDHASIVEKLRARFDVASYDGSVNPKHGRWSGVEKSIRLIATKSP